MHIYGRFAAIYWEGVRCVGVDLREVVVWTVEKGMGFFFGIWETGGRCG